MDHHKILVADGTEEFRDSLADALQGSYYVRSSGDGPEALSILHSFRPDILILDLCLPGLDGISLLHSAAEAGICPKVLVTARFVSEYMADALGKLGVEYIMIKPCDVRKTIDRIQDLNQRIHPSLVSQPDPRKQVASLLYLLGIPSGYDGHAYLREAIPLIMERPTMAMTKELYPTVGKLVGTTTCGGNVERSIRNAIDKGWKNRDDQIWQMYFPKNRDGIIRRPPNGTFIHTLANSLRMQQNQKIG